MRLESDADQVQRTTPARTNPGQENRAIKTQSLRRRSRLQVRAVRMERARKVVKVRRQAASVPSGMEREGDRSSPAQSSQKQTIKDPYHFKL